MKSNFLFCFLLLAVSMQAQTNVRAWYAQGQVWILWETASPYPETFGIYKSPQAFSNISQATIIGRPFNYEYLPGTFIQQTNNLAFTYTIPKPDGSTYTLAPNEALFVETVTGPGSAWYAVVEWGKTAVTAGVNSTANAVSYTYDPVKEPVTCHLQLANTLAGGYKARWYCLWLLGRQDISAGRPDFPVLANFAKNGMPAMFIVSESLTMDTTAGKHIPATHWLHGSGGKAIQQTADKFKQFGIAPIKGITVAHNDDFPQKLLFQGDTAFSSGRSAWFGWTKNFNPFNAAYEADPGDTVFNYTQRRILWINNWLIQHYRVDPDWVALQGYSMGSDGVSALAKAYPDQFSTVCAFNNGFRRVNEETIIRMHGSVEENLPTNLRDGNNQPVHINEMMDMNTPASAIRDLPLFRTWAGKTDPNDRMHWGPDLVAQYRVADSLGWGMQISWDERPHVYDILGYHWIQDLAANAQTYRDNVAYQELFRSKQSFPAFFNHRLDPQNNDPGTGVFGINTGDGDNWGTWGGYHNWEIPTIADEAGRWAVTAWLSSFAVYGNDNCPVDSLTADMAIRRPQQFKPAPGKTLQWKVKLETTGAVLQSGTTVVRADGLVVLPKIVVYKEPKAVTIVVTDPTVAVYAPETQPSWSVFPNPSTGRLNVSEPVERVRVFDLAGKQVSERMLAGSTELDLSTLPRGVYVLELAAGDRSQRIKWVKD